MLSIEGIGNPEPRELRSPLLEGFRELRLAADWGIQRARLERMAATKP